MAQIPRRVVKYPDSCLLQFAKAPLLGSVKTRLEPSLNKSQCLRLHESLVAHQFLIHQASAVSRFELWCSAEHSFFNRLTKDTDVQIKIQRGLTLGDRMANAFVDRLKQFSRVVIIGSDCPALQEEHIARALDALVGDVPAVFGPAKDGGYVLIGLNRFNPTLFEDVPWGTENVMDVTRSRLKNLGWQWEELAPLSDIDRPEDLVELSNFAKFHKLHSLFS